MLCGCKSANTFTPQKNLDCSFSYINNGIEYNGTIKSYNHSHLEIKMLSPTLIKGLKYTKNEKGGSISYLGLKVSTNQFEKGVFEAIGDALSKISLNGLSFEKTKEGYFAKSNNLKLSFNKSGYLTKLNFNDIDINFYDYK